MMPNHPRIFKTFILQHWVSFLRMTTPLPNSLNRNKGGTSNSLIQSCLTFFVNSPIQFSLLFSTACIRATVIGDSGRKALVECSTSFPAPFTWLARLRPISTSTCPSNLISQDSSPGRTNCSTNTHKIGRGTIRTPLETCQIVVIPSPKPFSVHLSKSPTTNCTTTSQHAINDCTISTSTMKQEGVRLVSCFFS